MTGGGLAARLGRGERIGEPVALVVAHPDDEVVGLGAHLHLFARLMLVHLTDGALADPADARRAGFATARDYAEARARELDGALEVLAVRPERRLAYGLPDQALAHRTPGLTERLARDLTGRAAVFTHAYEGGHPDHDAAALAVAAACARLGADAPERWEFAGYYGAGGVLHANRFHPDPLAPETVVVLDSAARRRKAQAFSAHASQAEVLANLPPGEERWRPAPGYDFTQPPPCGETHYDRYGWALTGAAWRAAAGGAVTPPAAR